MAKSAARPSRPPSPAAPGTPLSSYWAKRDFTQTPEPRGERGVRGRPGQQRAFVVQKHAATRLHYDFRLEVDGVMVSWAVPKGPSYDPADKRLAVHVEDHPLSYNSFEGSIPKGHYGAGSVLVWDRGSWEPQGDPAAAIAKGKLVFRLHGQKLAGLWELVRTAPRAGQRQEHWLLFKKRDEFARARSDYDVVAALPDSIVARPLPAVAAADKPAAGAAPAPRRPSARLTGAVPAALPPTLKPQLATLASNIPTTGDWLCEIKFDGYRLLARVEHGEVRLLTRNGHDWTAKMPGLARAIAALGIASAWLDGEIVVLDPAGLPNFNALQQAFDAGRETGIVYYLFDLPFFDGQDLRAAPLSERRALLERLLAARGAPAGDPLRFSEAFDAAPAELLASACRLRLEGVIAKRADAPYTASRSASWLKLKCKSRQEFVVCGYSDRSDGSPQIGSLLLGVHDAAGRLVPVGSVGTGWNAEEARRLKTRLAALRTDRSPFAGEPGSKASRGRWTRRTAGAWHWLAPTLVAEVAFAAWTADQQIRHATFLGLRADKPATAIVREATPLGNNNSSSSRPRAASASATAIPITHGERVIDASTGLTKLDLLRYYQSVAAWILPHLQSRPVSLLRAPRGVGSPVFFQKHDEAVGIPGITELDPALWPGHRALLAIDSAQALVGAAQMNAVELHTWNSTTRRIERPDRMIFDLDPGEGTAWPEVQEAALLVRALLTELGLQAWLKTSGGQGLHLVVPLAPRHDYDTVKAFSKAIVQHLAKTIPARFVSKSGAANRVGRLFVDYLRNGRGATTVAAFSARARPGLGVSMPIAWDELAQLRSAAQWTVASAREHLSFQRADPWADYAATRQSLGAAMRLLGFDKPRR
ncbi:MAG: DNA ligase D [Burkholderiaceae bacterium]